MYLRDILKGARKLEDQATFKMQREYRSSYGRISKGNIETGDRHMQRGKLGNGAKHQICPLTAMLTAFGGATKEQYISIRSD